MLDADESDETEALILTALEERVAQRNQINADRMRRGNTLATKVFARDSIVSLVIPLNIRLSGERRRVFCRVVQHTASGYQLNTKYGLLNHRYPHSELNGVDEDNGEIPRLTVQEAKKAKKITLNMVVSQMNSRDPIWATQRAGRKRRQGQREHLEGDTIEVEINRPIRRQRIEVVEGSSPSTRRVNTRAYKRRGQ